MSGWSADFSPRVPGRRNYPICGFAPGDYVGRCRECGKHFLGDKRAWHCEPCAVPMHDRWVAAEKTRIAELEAEYGPYTGPRP